MSEQMRDPSLETSIEKELMSTEDVYEAIAAAASGKQVEFTYSAHYQSTVSFEADGRVIIEDQGVPAYEHKMGDNKSGIDAFVTDMRRAIETVKKAQQAVPVGNAKDFGGLKGISKSVMDTNRVNAYIGSFEKMTPEEQENFRNTMSDKRA